METEDKRRTHASGHETPGGHVCHKCGWTFPNPHPSAKHRRAHKKFCGKIDGLQLIYFEDKTNNDSDDDHHPSAVNVEDHIVNDSGATKAEEEVLYLNRLLFDTLEPVVGGLNDNGGSAAEVQGISRIEEEVSLESAAESVDVESSRGAKEVVALATQEPHHELENSSAESSDILQPIDLKRCDKVCNPDAFESEPVKLHNDLHVRGHALPPTDPIGPSISVANAGSSPLEPEVKTSTVEPEKPTNDYIGHEETDTSEVMKFVITEGGSNLDAGGDGENARAENSPSVCMIPSIPTSSFYEMGSKLHKTDDLFELEVQVNLPNASIEKEMAISSSDKDWDSEELDSTITYVPEVQTDTSGQLNLQVEAFPTIQLASMELEGDNGRRGNVGIAKVLEGGLQVYSKQKVNVENQGDMAEGCNQHGKLEITEDILVQNVSEIKHEFCSDSRLVQQELDLTSTISEVIRNTEIHPENAVQQEADLGFMPTESIETEGLFLLSKQVPEDSNQVDNNGRTMQEELTVDQSDLDGNHIDGGSQFVVLDSGVSAVEALCFDEADLHPGDDNSECTANKGPTLVNTSNELDATGNHLEENKLDCSVIEEEARHGLSHEILPETPVVSAAGDPGLCVESTVCQETATDIGACDAAAYNESRDDKDCIQERAKARYSSPTTELCHEYMPDDSEDKPDLDPGRSDREGDQQQQLTKYPFVSTDVTSTGMDSHTNNLKNSSEPYSKHSNNLHEVSQESSQQFTVGNCTDPSTIEGEAQAGQNGIHSASDDLHQELKSSQFTVAGLCQVDMQNSTSVEHESLSSLSLVDCRSRDSAQGHASDSHYHSVEDGGNGNILKHSSNSSALAMDASVESISQTDSIEGHWGSGSDGTVPSTTDVAIISSAEAAPNDSIRTSIASSDALLKKDTAFKEHHADGADLFEAPSFMTLVEPAKDTNRQQATSEIHFSQKRQSPNSPQPGWFPSLTNIVNESQGRKKNEEHIKKVVNWSSGKTHTSLSRLLIEANLESKHKSLTAQERTTLMTHEGQVSQDIKPSGKTTAKISTVTTDKAAGKKQSNSPARFLVTKREKRKMWIPFAWCSSID